MTRTTAAMLRRDSGMMSSNFTSIASLSNPSSSSEFVELSSGGGEVTLKKRTRTLGGRGIGRGKGQMYVELLVVVVALAIELVSSPSSPSPSSQH